MLIETFELRFASSINALTSTHNACYVALVDPAFERPLNMHENTSNVILQMAVLCSSMRRPAPKRQLRANETHRKWFNNAKDANRHICRADKSAIF